MSIHATYGLFFATTVAPLALLTASLFSQNRVDPNSMPTPPELRTYQESLAAAERQKAMQPDILIVEDPAGLSTPPGALTDDVGFPYQFAAAIENLERAIAGGDSDSLQRAIEETNRLHQQYQPKLAALAGGQVVLKNVAEHTKTATRRHTWLINRKKIAATLAAVAKAIEEADDEGRLKTLLDTLATLREELPDSAEHFQDADSETALTTAEDDELTLLRDRTTFRLLFEQRVQQMNVAGMEAALLERSVSDWKKFLEAWPTEKLPTQSDRDVFREAEDLLHETVLKHWQAKAAGSTDAVTLIASVDDWLKEADIKPGDLAAQRNKAVDVCRKWLEDRVPLLKPLPQIAANIEEAWTQGGKRFLGFFAPIPAAQSFRFWPWTMPPELREAKPKGDKQFSVKEKPARPQHEDLYDRYTEARDSLLDKDGFRVARKRDQFRDDVDQVSKDLKRYQGQWQPREPDEPFPWDKTAERWPTGLEKSLEVIDKFNKAVGKRDFP